MRNFAVRNSTMDKEQRHTHPNMQWLWTLLWFCMSSLTAQAQFYNGMNMDFGKNRVQWKDFKWSYYKNENFDVYYYQGGDQIAQYVQKYAKDEIPILEKKFGNHFSKKVQFLVFNSLSDLKQSNLNNNNDEDHGNTGGVTKILGSKICLYFNGNYIDFEHQIQEGISQLLMNQVMNGSSIGSQIRHSYSYDIPEWFQNGLCAYLAEDWDSYKEDRLQRGILSGEFKKIQQLRDEDAMLAGYSFWGFIEERYGSKAFNSIMTLAESTMNVKKALLFVTSTSYKDLIKEWYQFYLDRYSLIYENHPTEVMPLRYKKYRTFSEPEVSPDGSKIAYVSNDEGRIGIYIEDVASKKRERVYKTGYRSDEWVDTSFPLLAWHPSGTILSFIVEEEGRIQLCNLDIKTKKVGKTYLYEFQKITSFSYAHRDRKIVMAASRFGKPDLYIYNLFSNTIEQLTDDYYTDLTPVFSIDDRQVLFSSNRPDEDLESHHEMDGQRRQFNLFSYDIAVKSLRNLTKQKLSNSIEPKSFADGKITFLNDSSGYYNLFEAQFDSVISSIDTAIHYNYLTICKPITNYTTSIIDYSFDPRTKRLLFLLPDGDGEKIYTSYYRKSEEDLQLKQMSPYAQKRIMTLRQVEEQEKERQTEHRFKNSYRIPRRKRTQDAIPDSLGYVEGSENILVARKDTVQHIQNYYVEMFSNELTSQIDFSYLNYSYQPFSGGSSPVFLNSGFNVFLGTKMADLMEDYKIEAGIKLNTSLINNEYVLRFSDLSKRVDKTITLHRYVTDAYETYYHRTFTDEAFYTLSYPFSEVLSLRGTLIFRNDYRVSLAIDGYSLAEPNQMVNWGGVRGELVYDNSKKLQTNLYVGSRGKIFAEYYQLLHRETSNMIVLGLDYRHYTRISRNFIWANRIAGSTAFGQDKLIYYMGGVDNYINARFNHDTPIDYAQNYAYQTLATNMRGFEQNIRNGNSFVVYNSELRFPVFSYLLNRPINKEFIKNFQLIAFGDVGTAWTGWNPYDLNNSLYTSHYYDGSLAISVTQQKEPIVGGIGFGARTTILGYFVRCDVGWGIEDRAIRQKPVIHLSFNLDF